MRDDRDAAPPGFSGARYSTESLRGVTNFVAAAQSNSFTRAASELGITKSAVGKSVARLEERLGIRLFHRSTRKLSLTSDGEAYLKSCMSALDILDAAEHSLCRRQEVPSGTVRIDMPASLGRNLVAPLLSDIAIRYPALRFVLTFNDRLIDPIEEGTDLVLRLGELDDTDALIARRLSRQRLVLCAAPSYLDMHGEPTTIDELSEHCAIVGYRRGSPLPWRIKPTGQQTKRYIAPHAHEISDGDAALQFCVSGLGVAQFPEAMIKHHLRDGTLVEVMKDFAPDPMDLNIVWPKTKHLFPKIRLVVDALLEQSAKGLFGGHQ